MSVWDAALVFFILAAIVAGGIALRPMPKDDIQQLRDELRKNERNR